MVDTLDVSAAQATVEDDRDAILGLLRQEVGYNEVRRGQVRLGGGEGMGEAARWGKRGGGDKVGGKALFTKAKGGMGRGVEGHTSMR